MAQAGASIEKLEEFNEALRSLNGKELIQANKAALRMVGNKTLSAMRKLVSADIPGAKLPPGYTHRNKSERKSNTPSMSEVAQADQKSLAKGGSVKVWKDGNGFTVSAMKPYLLRVFVTGAKARKTKQGYNRGDLMIKNGGEGGDYVRRAGKMIAPQVSEMLDEMIAKQMVRRFEKKMSK